MAELQDLIDQIKEGNDNNRNHSVSKPIHNRTNSSNNRSKSKPIRTSDIVDKKDDFSNDVMNYYHLKPIKIDENQDITNAEGMQEYYNSKTKK